MKRILLILAFSFLLSPFSSRAGDTVHSTRYIFIPGISSLAACPGNPNPYYPFDASCNDTRGNADNYAVFIAEDSLLYKLTNGALFVTGGSCGAVPNPFYPYDASCNITIGNNDLYAQWYVLHLIDSVIGSGTGTISGSGAANDITFWTSSHVIFGNPLFKFLNGNVGIRQGTPRVSLQIGNRLQDGAAADSNTSVVLSNPTGNARNCHYVLGQGQTSFGSLDWIFGAITSGTMQLSVLGHQALSFSQTSTPPLITVDSAYTLPNTAGTNGYVLTTNGTNAATWAPISAGTVTGTGAIPQVALWNGTSSINGNSNFTFNTNHNDVIIGAPLQQSLAGIVSAGNSSTYYQYVFQNTNEGTGASVDLVQYNDLANTTPADTAVDYHDWGYNSSTNVDPNYTAFYSNQAYDYNNNGANWFGAKDTVGFVVGAFKKANRGGYFLPTGLVLSQPLAIASGGTGATTAAGARTNLGLVDSTIYTGTPTVLQIKKSANAFTLYLVQKNIDSLGTVISGVWQGSNITKGFLNDTVIQTANSDIGISRTGGKITLTGSPITMTFGEQLSTISASTTYYILIPNQQIFNSGAATTVYMIAPKTGIVTGGQIVISTFGTTVTGAQTSTLSLQDITTSTTSTLSSALLFNGTFQSIGLSGLNIAVTNNDQLNLKLVTGAFTGAATNCSMYVVLYIN